MKEYGVKTEAILSVLLGHTAPVDPKNLGETLVGDIVGPYDSERREQAWEVARSYARVKLPYLARLHGPWSSSTEKAWCKRMMKKFGSSIPLSPPLGIEQIIMGDLVNRIERIA